MQPATDRLAEEAAALGAIQVVTASGPGDPASPYGGIYFYGIHAVDVALRLTLGKGYGEPALRAFLEMTRTGVPPIAYDDLVRPMVVLDAIDTAPRA